MRVFDVGSSTPAGETIWRQSTIYCAVISPEGTQALAGTSDGRMFRFRLGRAAARPLVLPRPAPLAGPALFLPESPARVMVLAEQHATVIKVASGDTVGEFPVPDTVLDFGAFPESVPTLRPDLKFMVVRTERLGWQSWELGPEGVRRVVPLQGAVNAPAIVTVSPMSDLVAVGNPTSLLQVWSLRTGALIGPPLAYPGFLNPASPSFSPDERRFAVRGARDGSAFVFDLATGKPLLSLNTRRQVRTAAARFSPDGERILTTDGDGEARLWNATTGEPLGPVVRMPGSLRFPVFSRDGRWAAIDNAATVAILDGRTGIEIGRRVPRC